MYVIHVNIVYFSMCPLFRGSTVHTLCIYVHCVQDIQEIYVHVHVCVEF